MSQLTVQPFFGGEVDKVPIIDLHQDEVEGFAFFQKICPSSVRREIIERANERGTPELIEIVNTLVRYDGMVQELYGAGIKDPYSALIAAVKKLRPGVKEAKRVKRIKP